MDYQRIAEAFVHPLKLRILALMARAPPPRAKLLAGKLTMANGGTISRAAWLRDETPALRDPRLVLCGPSIRATNGVIHTIDRVLVPTGK